MNPAHMAKACLEVQLRLPLTGLKITTLDMFTHELQHAASSQ